MIREHIQYLSALAMFLMLAGCEKESVPEEPEKVGQQQAEQSADDREVILGS